MRSLGGGWAGVTPAAGLCLPGAARHTGVRLQREEVPRSVQFSQGEARSLGLSCQRLTAELQGGREGTDSCLQGRTCFAQASRGWTAGSRLQSLPRACARGSFIGCLVEKAHWDTVVVGWGVTN